jgi:signal peptidase II
MRDAQDPDVLTDPPRSSLSQLRWSLPTALAVIAVDQLTKRWALSTLTAGSCDQPDACIDLVGGLRLHLVYNTGAAFTRGEGYGPLIGVVAFVMAGFLLYLSTRRTDRVGIVLFGAIAGGAIGNLLDRIFRADDGLLSGAVIDFIDVQWWPVFNIADSAIVVGVIGLMIHMLFERPDDEHPTPEDDRAGNGGTAVPTGGDGSDRGGDEPGGAGTDVAFDAAAPPTGAE